IYLTKSMTLKFDFLSSTVSGFQGSFDPFKERARRCYQHSASKHINGAFIERQGKILTFVN
ncbi:MAG: hypothetical protein ACOYCA_06045, partial [Eggerthellaceae bacterium]